MVIRRKRAVESVRLPSWTIMVFMVDGPELGPSLDRDLLELDRAGSSNEVNVVVAIQSGRAKTRFIEIQPRVDGARGPRRRVLGRAKARDVTASLGEFLAFVAEHRPARQYALILWGHASGFGFGRIGPESEEDLVQLGQLRELIWQFRKTREEKQKLEILGFCACALSKAEFALELRDDVDFLVASQVAISTLMTWPFDRIVQRALMSPAVPPQTFASQIVQSFEELYEPPPVALTALNLTGSEPLKEQIDDVAEAILKALGARGPSGRLNNLLVLQAFKDALTAYPFNLESLVDFFDFCVRLVEQDGLAEPVRHVARSVLNEGVQAFVARNARSGPKLAALNGLSILAPDFDDPNWLETSKTLLAETNTTNKAWLYKTTRWVEMTRKVYQFATTDAALQQGQG